MYLHGCWEDNNATPSPLATVFTGSAGADTSFVWKKKKSVFEVLGTWFEDKEWKLGVRSDALQVLMWVAWLARMRTLIFNASLTSVTPVSEAAVT